MVARGLFERALEKNGIKWESTEPQTPTFFDFTWWNSSKHGRVQIRRYSDKRISGSQLGTQQPLKVTEEPVLTGTLEGSYFKCSSEYKNRKRPVFVSLISKP